LSGIKTKQVKSKKRTSSMPRKPINRKAEATLSEITSRGYYNYDSIKCLGELYSADHIIDRMKFDRHSINKNLESVDTWNSQNIHNPLENILSVDDKCLCAGGWAERPYVNKNTCIGCEILRRISKGVKTPEDGIITIETGNYIGQSFSITIVESFFSPYIINRDSSKINIKLSLNNQLKINTKLKHYSTVSPVTNYVSICSFIYNRLMKNRMTSTPLFEWAYQCSKNVTIVEVHPNLGIGSINLLAENSEYNKTPVSPTARNFLSLSLKNNVTISILKQIFSTLHYLSIYNFCHGSPSLRYLAFSKKPTHYKYDNCDISSPITVHIIPSYFACIDIKTDTSLSGGESENIRIFNKNYSNIYKQSILPLEKIEYFVGHKNTKEPQVSSSLVPMMSELDSNLVLGYKIGNKIDYYNELITRKGINLYCDSFNSYLFLCSLMTEEAFYSSFIENENLSFLWYNLWKPSEFESLNNDIKILRIREHSDPVSFEELYKIVSNYTLREDGLEYIWNSIKNL
jgi:hypothetical protein